MASTYTDRTRAILQGYGDNPDAWGPELNTALQLLDSGWGVVEVAVNGNVILTAENGLPDQARNAVLILSGAGGFAVTHPEIDKPYLVLNNCSNPVTLTPNSGTGAPIRAGFKGWYTTNAAGDTGYAVDLALNAIAPPDGSVDMNGQKLTSMAAGSDGTDGATLSNRLDQFAAPTDPVSMGGEKITDVGDAESAGDAVSYGFLQNFAGGTNLGAVAAISADVQAVGAITANVTTVANIAADVSSVAANATDVSTVADNIQAVIDASSLVDGAAAVNYEARTSNTTLVKADARKMIDITSGTFTQTFASAATLEAGWMVYIRNSGTGTITLDPDGSETIDGGSTVSLTAGQLLMVLCDGSVLRTVLLKQPPGLALLRTETVPAGGVGAVDFLGIDGTYDEYEIHLLNVKPEVSNKLLGLRLSTDNGANFLDTGYAARLIAGSSGGTAVSGNGTQTAYIPLTFGVNNDAASGGVRGVVKVGSPASASIFTDVGITVRCYAPTEANVVTGTGTHLTAAAHNAIRFFFTDASDIAEGSIFRLYGIRK